MVAVCAAALGVVAGGVGGRLDRARSGDLTHRALPEMRGSAHRVVGGVVKPSLNYEGHPGGAPRPHRHPGRPLPRPAARRRVRHD